MQIWDTLLGSATETDLLRLGEALAIGPVPRTAMGVLQALLSAPGRPGLTQVLDQLGEDSLRLACTRLGLPAAAGGEQTQAQARAALLAAAGQGSGGDWLQCEVPRRRPRLAWQGMQARPAITGVPTQVLEVVSPGLASRRDERQGELEGLGAAKARADSRAPVNRLIWTNDNLVALKTLLEERDPLTRDWRYRGKVDLIYIDPPFMVNSDFVADNSISIDVDGEAGVAAVKEPSLVEILAYKDTWREGLDSFLSMIRARLQLLKELLAPSGSIYVHLDWHAAHYVKVLMDEIFGYENFINEVIWQRQTSHGDAGQGAAHFGRIHDVILIYGITESRYANQIYSAYSGDYIRSHYSLIDETGRRYQLGDLNAPGGSSAAKGNPYYEVFGHKKYWRFSEERMHRLIAEGRVVQPSPGATPRYKRFLDEMTGVPTQDIWTDVNTINSQATESLGYPTQKPVALLERIISASCPPGGLVLDCFMGSGTTAEAAERLGRRWIGIDNGKYAVHLARKRLIQLQGQPRPPAKEQHDYVECDHCGNIERKPKKQRSPGTYAVRPFSVESMGVYLRAEAWLTAAGEPAAWRPEMIRVFGGEPVSGFALLHGRDHRGWIHVGPLDAPVPMRQAWGIAREAAQTDTHFVTILSADLDTLPHPEREDIRAQTGVQVTLRIIPNAAIEQVALRLKRGAAADGAIESMAVPAFYTPLAIGLTAQVDGPLVKLCLERCEVDVQSFLLSQQPALKPVTDSLAPAQRKKAVAEQARWQARRAVLLEWLERANTWQQFVDFWAIDWDYADHIGPDGRPVFDTDWQSFRIRRGKGRVDPLVLTAECRYAQPGRYQIAARVTDVFGNDGISLVDVEVGQ
ncbi:site-specific DNA-methyltransferase [uncultured Thiodictyon sp.]|uniref:site-specific DNA-methyltransferase n=3 Tax=uncultured Thiodictyon sp. TaxID=1846217 RepID=UPI0025DDF345|nr:site-specific DNA-methyltransferase [uncultured Thiodictyon sp.]